MSETSTLAPPSYRRAGVRPFSVNATPSDQDGQTEKALEAKKKEWTELNALKVRTDVEIEECEKRISEHQDRAIALAGTADIAKMKELVASWRQENESAVQCFSDQIDQVRAELQKIMDEAASA